MDGQKKSLRAAERDAAARAAWRAAAAGLDAASPVFVDETGTNTAMTPRTARAPRGERAVGSAPRNHGPNVARLAALTPGGVGAAMAVAGAADGAASALFAERFLAPGLRPGQVVVLDNLSAHTDAAAREAVEAAGCRLLFLPAYSPDFDPIALAFAKVKPRLRRAAARTPDALLAAIGGAIAEATEADARGFDAHCGFPLP